MDQSCSITKRLNHYPQLDSDERVAVMKQRMIIILITLVVVLTAGWGAYEAGLLRWQPDNKTTKLHSSVKETGSSKAASSSQVSSQQSTTDQLDKNKLTPQQTASARNTIPS